MNVATIIPVGAGREENLTVCLKALNSGTRRPDHIVIVDDGMNMIGAQLDVPIEASMLVHVEKHEPGKEQPRNTGVRMATAAWPEITHAHFLDSDIVLEPGALEALELALRAGPEDRIVIAPYDWMPDGVRPEQLGLAFFEHAAAIRNDPRWEMFQQSPPNRVYTADLSAGLACFSGNLLWPVAEFQRVGGFWPEIHHGRCEDGELGLRAVAMDVPISLAGRARGYHLAHPVNGALALERNRRDVPMLNDRHPWVEQGAVFMVDRDGKAFDVMCPKCETPIPTIQWWAHAVECDTEMELPAHP